MISNASNKYERESDKKRKAALATHKLAHQLQAQSGPYKRPKIQERIPYYDQPRNQYGKFTKNEPPELEDADQQFEGFENGISNSQQIHSNQSELNASKSRSKEKNAPSNTKALNMVFQSTNEQLMQRFCQFLVT